MYRHIFAGLVLHLGALHATGTEIEAQRTVRVSDAWVKVSEESKEAAAYVNVDNGTMYDVYIVGVESEVAGIAELRRAVKGEKPPAKVVNEATVPAFGQLAMSAEGLYIHLSQLKRPLKLGETINVALTLDNGQALAAAAIVK